MFCFVELHCQINGVREIGEFMAVKESKKLYWFSRMQRNSFLQLAIQAG